MFQIPPNIRGLIFDCDGTLADTMPLHYASWVQAFAEKGYPFPEPLFYSMAGCPTAKIIRIFNEEHGYRLPVDETALRKTELYAQNLGRVKPIEPVVKLVREYHGILAMSVATGETNAICTSTLKTLGILDRFVAIIGSDNVQHGKPAPDIFLECARRMNVKAEECCVFEDGDLGIQGAKAAGMMTVDVRNWLR